MFPSGTQSSTKYSLQSDSVIIQPHLRNRRKLTFIDCVGYSFGCTSQKRRRSGLRRDFLTCATEETDKSRCKSYFHTVPKHLAYFCNPCLCYIWRRKCYRSFYHAPSFLRFPMHALNII